MRDNPSFEVMSSWTTAYLAITEDSDDDDDDEDDLPSIEDLFRSMKPRSTRHCNDQASEQTHQRQNSISIPMNGMHETWRPQTHRLGRDSSSAASTADLIRREVIDLTTDLEYCVVCSNVLGQSNGNAGRVFEFEDCGCVGLHLVPMIAEAADSLRY